MAIEKKQLNLPINSSILDEFKQKCKMEGLKYNIVIEALMDYYINNDFEVITTLKLIKK